MAPKLSFNYFWDEGHSAWRISIPKSISITNKREYHEFFSEDDAKNAQKIYLRLVSDHGKTLKIPTQTQLYGSGRIKKFITYKHLIDTAKAIELSDGVDHTSKEFKDAVDLVKARSNSKKLSDLIEVIPAQRKSNGTKYNPEHLKELIRQTKKLIETFGDIHLSDFDNKELNLIDDFLDSPKWNYSLNAKAKYKGALSSVFKVAFNQRWIKENPVHRAITRASEAPKAEYYRVDVCQRILYGASMEMLPTYAISLFTGIRPSECRRINFENIIIKADSAFLTLDSNQARKKKKARPVQLNETAKQWLYPFQGMKGPISPLPQTQFDDKSDFNKWYDHHFLADLVKNKNRSGGSFKKSELIKDGFRHTYGTYQYWKMIYEGYSPDKAEAFVINQLGHKDNSSIEHYISFDPPQQDVMQFWSLQPPKELLVGFENSDFYKTRIAS